MNWKLFLDDLRDPDYVGIDLVRSPSVVVARNSDEAIAAIVEKGAPAHIWFDHDLGGEDTAMNVVNWMIEQDLDGNIDLSNLTFSIHSSNPVGRDNISGKLSQYITIKNHASLKPSGP